eukprot:2869146-Prymnesium_polylepis.1
MASGKAPRGYEKVDGQFGEPLQTWLKFMPDDASCYELVFDQVKHKWVMWVDTIAKEDTRIPANAEFSQIIVPTLDTARYTFILDKLLAQGMPSLFVGPTGTGKTSYVQKLLLRLPSDAWQTIFLNFSAQTSAN